jgi:cell division protein ZapA
MNVVTVKINGVEYNLKGQENEEYLYKVAGYVDKKIKGILSKNKKLSVTDAAVLTAANIVDELLKYERAYNELSSMLTELQKNEGVLMEQISNMEGLISQMESSEVKSITSTSDEEVQGKDEKIRQLTEEFDILKEYSQQILKERESLITENKELKFQLRSENYKLLNLKKQLEENQIDLVKMKKKNNPLLKTESK